MAAGSRRHRTRTATPGSWAWWVLFALLAGTAGFFWLIGHDLSLERAPDPASKETAQNRR